MKIHILERSVRFYEKDSQIKHDLQIDLIFKKKISRRPLYFNGASIQFGLLKVEKLHRHLEQT